MNRYVDLAYCAMRIVIGLLFACHGGTKILGFPASSYGPAANTLGLVTGWIELSCGLLVAAGVFTRAAAFFASGEMAVAYFWVSASRGLFPIANGGEMAVAYFTAHWKMGHASFWPLVNKGELAVIYCFVFFFIFAHGSGRWSVTKR